GASLIVNRELDVASHESPFATLVTQQGVSMPVLPGRHASAGSRSSSLDRRALLIGAANALGLASLAGARAAAARTPSRPVHVFVGYPAGGAVDIVVRLVGEGVRRTSGVVVVGEVRSGAYGVIAAQAAAIAPPDGYTLASAIMGMMSVLPALPGAKMVL